MESIVRSRASDKMRIHRMWVVFDSDALVPNCPSAEAESKAVACRAAGARFHMLLRRAIENYLPPEIIDNSLPRSSGPSAARKAAGALRRLSPEQRAHYNLKGGFNADLARVSPGGKDAAMRDRIQALYAQLGADGDRDALSGGFGRDIAELFVPNPAAGRPRISEATRRSDGQEPEMHALIRSIVRSL